MPTNISVQGESLAVRFPYNPVKVQRMSKLNVGTYDADTFTWFLPSHMLPTLRLLFNDLIVEPEVDQLCAIHAKIQTASTATDASFHVDGLGGDLMPFQRAGVQYVAMRNGRALVGDDMGLGKTVQALAWLQLHPELRPAAIVCPASVKLMWQNHIESWVTERNTTAILNGQTASTLPAADVFILNFDIAKFWKKHLNAAGLRCIVVDEAQYLKSPTSQRTKAIMSIAERAESVLLLSGTPLLNRPAELWPLLNIIDPQSWGNWFGYAHRYCNARRKEIRVKGGKKRTIWDFSGASNTDELHDAVTRYMVRRKKSDVLKDLKPKRRVVVPMEIPPAIRYEYDKIKAEVADAVERAKANDEPFAGSVLAMMEQLKQLTARAKLPQAVEWVRDFIESEKLILFVTHKFVVAELLKAFPDAVAITGDTPQSKRQDIVDRFQNDDKTRLFIGNIQAAGVGLTLTAASNVAFLELDWTPANHEQAEDRAHRIGQMDSVTAWYLLAERSIDQDIFGALERKRLIVESVVDGAPSGGLNFNANVIEEVAELVAKS